MSYRIGISSAVLSNHRRRHRLDGIGMYTKNLCEGLAELQCDVVPVTYTPLLRKNKINNPVLPNGLAFPYPGYMDTIQFFTRVGVGYDFKEPISLYHSTDYSVPKLHKMPIVATLHDALLLQNVKGPLQKITNWMMKQRMQWSDRFIAISKSIVPDLIEYWGVREERIDVVHNGIPSVWWQPVSAEQKKRVLDRLKLHQPFLLFVGTLQPRKNVTRIITAYKNLSVELRQHYKLVVAGSAFPGSDELILELKNLASKDQAVWLDYVSNEDLRVLYQQASLFVFPSLAEGFGLPIVEAFASKTPVITSDRGAMAEVAGDAALLIDPYSVEQITHAMQALLTDLTLRQEYIAKGLQRSLSFTLSNCAQKTLAVYKRLL